MKIEWAPLALDRLKDISEYISYDNISAARKLVNKIFKKVETILLESTGELRKLRSPTLFLDGVLCDGSQQGGCARSCFHFWRDVWLKRVTE